MTSMGKHLITDMTIGQYVTALKAIGMDSQQPEEANIQNVIRARKFGKDSGKIDADHHRMYI